jgi:hypothetical protein
MSILKNLKNDASIKDETDRLGGGGVLNTGVYPLNIKLAYINVADSGAIALNLHAETPEGRNVKQQFWMTSGKAKGGQNFYTDKQGVKNYLPGYLLAESLALLTTGKSIGDLDTEEKVVNLYDATAKAEKPTKVQMVMELLNKDVLAGIIKQTVDKNVKNANGEYVPSGETRDENEIDKFFRARDKMTTSEIRGGAEKAEFHDKWIEKNGPDYVRNKAKGASGGTAGVPQGSSKTSKPTTSLFS